MTHKVRVIVEITLPPGVTEKESDLVAFVATKLPSRYTLKNNGSAVPLRAKEFSRFWRMFLSAQNGVNYFTGKRN